MDDRYSKKVYKGLFEILGDAFTVLKENWLTYLVVFMIMTLLGGAVKGVDYIAPNSQGLKMLMGLINFLMGGMMTIIFIVTTYNNLYQHQSLGLGERLTSKIMPLIFTQLLLILILTLPIFIILIGVSIAVMSISLFNILMPLVMFFMFLMMLVIAKLIFIGQNIVLDDRHYWQAIKSSWGQTKGHYGKIIGLSLTPAVLSLCVAGLTHFGWMNLYVMIPLSFMMFMVGIVVNIGFTILYLDITGEEVPQEEILIYG